MTINLPWDTKFEIGHERIDAEHRIFLNLIRELSLEAETGAPRERVLRTLEEIYKYADFHFTSEENIMADMDYPGLAAQEDAHGRLLTQLKAEMHDFRAGKQVPAAIVSFIFQWFALHTTQDDRQIAKFVVGGD